MPVAVSNPLWGRRAAPRKGIVRGCGAGSPEDAGPSKLGPSVPIAIASFPRVNPRVRLQSLRIARVMMPEGTQIPRA